MSDATVSNAAPREKRCADDDGKGESATSSTNQSTAENLERPVKSATILDLDAVKEADDAKVEGNKLYKLKDYDGALECYAHALSLIPDHEDTIQNRATYYANRAACYLQMEKYADAVKESTLALELDPNYLKALLRRAQAHDKLEHFEEELQDLKKVVELDPTDRKTREDVRRLEPIVAAKREKMKEEMLGKLKDLGNSLLGHFGLSTDNFKAVQNPDTGSYSINFQR